MSQVSKTWLRGGLGDLPSAGVELEWVGLVRVRRNGRLKVVLSVVVHQHQMRGVALGGNSTHWLGGEQYLLEPAAFMLPNPHYWS